MWGQHFPLSSLFCADIFWLALQCVFFSVSVSHLQHEDVPEADHFPQHQRRHLDCPQMGTLTVTVSVACVGDSPGTRGMGGHET